MVEGRSGELQVQASTLRRMKYLVCVNKHDASHQALRFACLCAQKRGGYVDVLHVLERPDFQSFSSVAQKLDAELRSDAEALLSKLCQEAQELTGITPSIILSDGGIVENIVKTLQSDGDITMLVLGVMPGGSTRGKLVAQVAAMLGEGIHVPVMLVPGNFTDEQLGALA